VTQRNPLDDAVKAFEAVAELIYQADSYGEVYEAICRAAVSAVPGCDHACVTTMRAGEKPTCEAATDEVARTVSEIESVTGQGPCLDAILTQSFEREPDITTTSAWPVFAARVVGETPVRGIVGYRILVGDRKAGALNLYSDTPGALTADAESVGAILAAFASVALAAASAHESARSLRDALDSNREIGKAIGLLMATNSLSDTEAFGTLREASSKLNMRLALVARQVIDDHNDDHTDHHDDGHDDDADADH
jgi:transcriptional regulator with GAF, ATPase, and Fis domain